MQFCSLYIAVKPTIVCSKVTRNSVIVTDPLIFQHLTRYSAREFALSDSFRLKRVPIDVPIDGENSLKFTSHDIQRDDDPSATVHEVTLHGNIAGKNTK